MTNPHLQKLAEETAKTYIDTQRKAWATIEDSLLKAVLPTALDADERQLTALILSVFQRVEKAEQPIQPVSREAALDTLQDYPNLQAIIQNTIAGHHTDWPRVAGELRRLLGAIGHASGSGKESVP